MTSDIYAGTSIHHTGDINLVASLMAMGIPLDPIDPVSVVDNEKGVYGSFSVTEYSEDGTIDTGTLMDAWTGSKPLPPEHGFSRICAFLRARPRGVQRSEDLLDFAVEYLRQQGHTLPGLRRLADIPAFVNALPEGEASYVLAYVWNRDVCFQLYKLVSKKLYYQEGEGRDARRAIIDTRLPRWQASEILSRLQG